MTDRTPNGDVFAGSATRDSVASQSAGDPVAGKPAPGTGASGLVAGDPDAGGHMTFAERLARPGEFLIVMELAPWAGSLDDDAGESTLVAARELAADARVAALSITDNAGGHPRLSPVTLAEEFVAHGRDVIVHVACRDRSRTALQSLGWELKSHGLHNILAISGDYPVEGYEGLSRAVFDLDSVSLLQMYAGMGGFTLGAGVSPYKRFERELIPQYLKLAAKIRAGASFVISQVGYDARKADEFLRYMALHELRAPAIANAYILTRGAARAFHSGSIPGCVVTDDLLALVERQATSPDKGRAFFTEFAAKQVAVARGLGYRGIYISGHRRAEQVHQILEQAAAFGANDWHDLVADISFPIPGTFSYFEPDATGRLNSDRVNQSYLRSRNPGGRKRARRVPFDYRVNRFAHGVVFDSAAPGFPIAASAYRLVERARLGRPLHVLEQAVKIPLYDCRDCGDCSLPDVAYLCPEAQCLKNQRNGPCGGSHDGMCESAERPCIWSRAYERLKPYGEELAMLEREPVVQDNGLRRTSAWANTFLGRDHFGRDGRGAGREPMDSATDRGGETSRKG